MVLNHIAAVLLFAGPLFYIGLWMMVDPAPLTGALGFVARAVDRQVKCPPDPQPAKRRIRTGVRCAGVILVLIAIAI